ncbi:hypothetical protein O1611_g209 [Lasiodiplodia mahajangana]|uniref:Uncharacterized protein n=1 Tax=Lasiodiplodia mahajangana TaxID=1108764 RepID=A0ACC2K100_9PEZI|nr:hypothetical protein O1611_g209 [Lasiodiplodia mahajangana]
MSSLSKQHIGNNGEAAIQGTSTQRDETLAPLDTAVAERLKKLGPGRPTVHRVPPPGCSGEEPEMPLKTGAKAT